MENDESSQMVFAQVQYAGGYADVHVEMVALMESQFSDIQSGLQSDSWIWIMDGNDRIAIDTFSSMKHQVKSYSSGSHVEQVIDALRVKYDVQVFDEPLEEWG
jgi:hypothetical protein